ncbi:MAG: hypothetical protein ACYS47_00180 [Planctomycetota bacterium]|jgi:hypothetical protein
MRWTTTVVLALAGLASDLFGADVEVIARLGFQENYRPNAFTPLRVEVLNRSDETRFIISVLGRNPVHGTEMTATPVSVPKGTRKALDFTSLVSSESRYLSDSPGDEVTVPVRVHREGGKLAAKADAKGSEIRAECFVLLAGTMRSAPGPRVGNKRVACARLAFDDLPRTPEAYEGVDVLFLSEPGSFLGSRPEVARALRDWVRHGGRLVVWGRESLFTTPPADWAGWVPRPAGLPAPVGTSDLTWLGPFEGEGVRSPVVRRFDPAGFDLLAADGAGALAVERWEGAGSAVFLALDPGTRGIQWSQGQKKLWTYLLERGRKSQRGFSGYGGGWTRDLADIVCNKADIEPVKYTTFLVVFLAFAVIIGPGITIALGKKKGPWVWLAVPLISGLFAAGTYVIALGERSGEALLYQITFVDGAHDSVPARFSSVVGLYASGRGWYELEFPSSDGCAGGLESMDLRGRELRSLGRTTFKRGGGSPHFAVYMNPYSARAFRANGALAPTAAARLGRGLHLRTGEAGAFQESGADPWLVNDTKLTLAGGWVVFKERAGIFEAVEPGGEARVRMIETPENQAWGGGAMSILSWDKAVNPYRQSGLLTMATYSRWESEWCPFDRTRVGVPSRCLIVALLRDGIAPAVLTNTGQSAVELVVLRTTGSVER